MSEPSGTSGGAGIPAHAAEPGSLIDLNMVLTAYERFGSYINRQQRRSDLAKLSVPEQVASSIRTMAREMSEPDERKETMASEHTRAMLRNTRTKTDLALYMHTHAAIERLAALTSMLGVVDGRMLDVMKLLKPHELVLLQKSLHTQSKELVEDLRGTGTEQLEAFLQSISPEKGQSTKATMENLSKLPAVSRERITAALQKLVLNLETAPVPTHLPEAKPVVVVESPQPVVVPVEEPEPDTQLSLELEG